MTATKHDPRRVFLSGPPGSGKTTIGRALAEKTRWPFVDLDERIAARAGKTVAAVFAEDGEPAFRAMERAEAMQLATMDAPVVVALGGGTVVDRDARRALIAAGTLIGLDGSLSVLAERARAQGGRPLLAGDVEGRLAALVDARRDAYAECAALVRTDARDVMDTTREVEAVVARDPIVVALGARTYAVEIGRGLGDRVGAMIGSLAPTSVVVVCDEHTERYARAVAESTVAAGLRVITITLPTGEEHKHARTVGRIWDGALDAGIDRQALVFAVGGGVVGDLAGFAAATLLRGIRLVQIPTTLLAMVDASVGGKTGFDHARGKNLVGAFHQPSGVLADLETLATLPARHVRAGLAEVVKMALVVGPDALLAIERDAESLARSDTGAIERATRMAVRAKAEIVARDERETLGIRDVLNIGHTIGHALEAAAGFGDAMLHGEAVALGTIAELCAFRGSEGGPSDELIERVTTLLTRLGLPTDLEGRLGEELLPFIAQDKKRAGTHVKVPRVRAAGDVVTERVESRGILERAHENLCAARPTR